MKYLISVIPTIILYCCNPSKTSVETISQVDASRLSAVKLTNLDGSTLDWKEVEGKAVFLNFWATWCRPCVREMPFIEEAARQLKEENIVFLLATEESAEKINSFQKKYGHNLDLVRQQTSLASLGINAIPTTYIYNDQGKQVFAETSVRKWDSEENVNLIRRLIITP